MSKYVKRPRALKPFDKRVDTALIAAEGLTGRVNPFAPALDEDYADNVERALGTLVTATAKPLPVGVARDVGNPKLTYGGSGAFDQGSLRDCCIWYARGRVWMLYTGATSAVTPFNPTIGLASSQDNGVTWTKHGRVIDKNPTAGLWNSGAIFSPGVWYDEATDELWVYVSGTVLASQWYSGPISIGAIKVAAGADWTSAASYTTYANAGNPVLSPTPAQAWESTQGTYSCCVKLLQGKWVMLYSSSNAGTTWKIGRATSDRPDGPFTKDPANPILGVTPPAEEADMLVLPGGVLISLTDDLSAGTGGSYGIGVWKCSSQDGLGTWTKVGQLITTGNQTFDGLWIGSSSACLLPDGSILIAYNGKAVGAPDDRREIGTARGLIELNVGGGSGGGLSTEDVQDIVGAMVVAGTNVTVTYNDAAGTLTINATGGGGGAGTTHFTYRDKTNLAIGVAPTIDTQIAGMTITIPGSATARVCVLDFHVVFTGGHQMRTRVYLDSAIEFPSDATSGNSAGIFGDQNTESTEYFVRAGGIVIAIPGDSATHDVKILWNTVSTTSAITVTDRSMHLQVF